MRHSLITVYKQISLGPFFIKSDFLFNVCWFVFVCSGASSPLMGNTDSELLMMNSMYKERFPKAKEQMEKKLKVSDVVMAVQNIFLRKLFIWVCKTFISQLAKTLYLDLAKTMISILQNCCNFQKRCISFFQNRYLHFAKVLNLCLQKRCVLILRKKYLGLQKHWSRFCRNAHLEFAKMFKWFYLQKCCISVVQKNFELHFAKNISFWFFQNFLFWRFIILIL